MALDYSKLTDDQLQAIADKDYSKLPDDVLAHLADEHDATENKSVGLSNEALAERNDPLTTAGAGALVGGAVGAGSKGLEFAKAIKNLGGEKGLVEPVAPTAPPKEYFAPGQKYMAKTGYGSGPGLTQEEVIAHQRAQEAPLGRGKVASKITGPASPDQILAAAAQREADDKVRARVIAQEKLIHDQAQAEYAAKQKEYLKQKNALAQEKKFGLPNKIGTTKAVTGATVGYNAMDLANQLQEGDYGQAALSGTGVLGAMAPYVKKLPPKLRAIGTGLSLLAPAVNRGVEAVENKATGGLVQHFQKGKLVTEGGSKVMEMLKNKMAPLYAKSEGIPSRLPRANPKTDAEIRAFAERMAPQVRGEFVRAPGETTSVAGKTLAQFEREKQLQHDIRDAYPLSKPPIYDEAAHQGKVKIGIAGDQTLTGKDVYGIAGNPLSSPSRQYGGALYPAAHPQGWASEKGAASGVQNLVDTAAQQYGDTGVVGQYMKMGPEASNYAMHNADAIIKSIDPNKVNKLDELNAMITAKFPDFAGLHNQADVLEQAKQDPNLRKFLDYLVQTKKHTEAYNLPSGQDIRHALSEPDLRNLEIGSTGKSIMQMHPGAKITPSSAEATTTYSHDIPGTYLGGAKYPRPHELEFADSHLALQNKIKSVQEMAEELVKENPGMDTKQALDYAKKFSHQGFGGFKLSQPRQIMDQQHMDEIGKYEDYMKELVGFAPGGKVSAAKKLLEEAQAAYKAKFTPGFYHGSPSPNIEAFDPTKSAKDPMYITPKATFVTRDPEFAESFLSMNNNGKIKSGSTMYPVNVNLGQHWNPNTPEGEALIAEFIEKYPKRVNLEKGLKRGDWTAIENSDFLSHLKDTGHDTFHVMEGGVPNVGVLKPENIRGKFAKFDPEEAASPDFMKAKGGLI